MMSVADFQLPGDNEAPRTPAIKAEHSVVCLPHSLFARRTDYTISPPDPQGRTGDAVGPARVARKENRPGGFGPSSRFDIPKQFDVAGCLATPGPSYDGKNVLTIINTGILHLDLRSRVSLERR